MTPLNIGITIGLHHVGETLWNNGIKQNAVFLAEALRQCSNVGTVTLLNTTNVPVTSELSWDLQRFPTAGFEEAKDGLDVLIELGGQIDAEQTRYLKARGVYLVSYCCGFEYVHSMESILFGGALGRADVFVNRFYDAIWMIPQVENISRSYFEVLRWTPAQVVPFVWSPMFLEQAVADFPDQGVYRPREGPKRLSVMEPNINVTKFCLYPILIAELAHRRDRAAIERLQVTNALDIAQNSARFIGLMNQLDIVRNHRTVFTGRHTTPEFLAHSTDVVISHQWENPLNYFYLEVCWQGYALIHNADLCQDLGYYYPRNDVRAGAEQLRLALASHDLEADRWRQQQRERIHRYLPHDKKLVRRYEDLLRELTARPARVKPKGQLTEEI